MPPRTTWRELFYHNWKRRFLWETDSGGDGVKRGDGGEGEGDEEEDEEEEEEESFGIRVSARFKPRLVPRGSGDEDRMEVIGGKKAVLPLHQRLALIKMNRKLDSNKDAFKVLKHQGGWFGKEMNDRVPGKTPEEKIADEDRDQGETVERSQQSPHPTQPSSVSLTGGVQLIDDANNSVVLVDRIKGLRGFRFDHVMKDSASQRSTYETATMRLVTEFLNGYNATCIVYGQTGSGKTHTMFGPNDAPFDPPREGEGNILPQSWGIVPRTVSEVFLALDYRKDNLNDTVDSDLFVSYVEIYGNDVTDLLRNGAPCGNSRVATQRYVLDGSAEVAVGSLGETIGCLNTGETQKKKAATSMNDRSSRAHSLFVLTLRQKCRRSGVARTSRLFLADLGGSEQTKKSLPLRTAGPTDAGSDEAEAQEQEQETSKQRMAEAIHINLGLLALKQCVTALRRKKHVPYSDSKLTLLLSTGLGGDSQTSVVVCGAQEGRHVAETIAAMRFGQVCRGISTTATADANVVQDVFEKINEGIAECEAKIKENERWEERDVRKYGDDGKLIEVRKTTVVVGAEEWHERLTALVRQKMELTGDDIDNVYANDTTLVQGFGNAHEYGMGNKVSGGRGEKDECVTS